MSYQYLIYYKQEVSVGLDSSAELLTDEQVLQKHLLDSDEVTVIRLKSTSGGKIFALLQDELDADGAISDFLTLVFRAGIEKGKSISLSEMIRDSGLAAVVTQAAEASTSLKDASSAKQPEINY